MVLCLLLLLFCCWWYVYAAVGVIAFVAAVVAIVAGVAVAALALLLLVWLVVTGFYVCFLRREVFVFDTAIPKKGYQPFQQLTGKK